MIKFNQAQAAIKRADFVRSFGEIKEITDHLLISKGPICKIGDICYVGEQQIPCEVIALKGENVSLMPFVHQKNVTVKEKVWLSKQPILLPHPSHLLGRTLKSVATG